MCDKLVDMPINARVRRALDTPLPLWCNASREANESTTFVYLGSDVDMTLLHLLQPFETRVRYWGTFGPPDYDYGAWDRAHANDTRLSYRQTTQSMRPLNASSSAERLRLGDLAYARLLDEQSPNLTDVQRVAPLQFRFRLDGIKRELNFILTTITYDSIVRFQRQFLSHTRGGRLDEQGQLSTAVSTIAVTGLWVGGDVTRTLIELTTHVLHAEALRARPLRFLDADDDELFEKLGEAGIYRSLVDVRHLPSRQVMISFSSHPDGYARLGGNKPLAAVCLYTPLTRLKTWIPEQEVPAPPPVASVSLSCNASRYASREANESTTFVYLGSDVDMTLLHLLQPFETRVRYWGTFGPPDYDYGAWDRAHANDTRLSYRQTTQSMRPLNASSSAERLRLGDLAYARLLDEQSPNLTDVQRVAPLEFRFRLDGIKRELNFILYSMSVVSSARFRRNEQMSTVSTIAVSGLQGIGDVTRTVFELAAHALQAGALRVRPLRILDREDSELFEDVGKTGIYRAFADVQHSSRSDQVSNPNDVYNQLGGNAPLVAVCLYDPQPQWDSLLAWDLMRRKSATANRSVHAFEELFLDAADLLTIAVLALAALWLSGNRHVRRCLRFKRLRTRSTLPVAHQPAFAQHDVCDHAIMGRLRHLRRV